jgi:putative ABC transport system permease protein
MIFYNLKYAFKRIVHNKYLSLINIIGLAIGISCCVLIFLFVYDELQFDKTFPFKDRLYRVYGNNFDGGDKWMANQPNRLYDQIIKEIPEIEKATVLCLREYTVTHGNTLSDEHFAFTDTSVFDITGWKLISGNSHYVLNEPMTVVISESAAKKLYGNKNPIGEKLRFNKNIDLTITGIFKDVPANTHIYADYLTSKLTRDSISSGEDHWGNFSSSIFVRLRPGTNPDEVSNKITALWLKYAENDMTKLPGSIKFKLQPLADIYLHSGFLHNDPSLRSGNYMAVVGFSIIGILILIIACFNYLNLTIAQANERSKEVGIRKTSGASISSLYYQFITESVVFTIIALLASLFIVQAIFPWFNQFTDKHLSLSGAFPAILYFVGAIVIFIIACTGLYPSFVMSSFATISMLKGKTNFWIDKKLKLQIFHQTLSKSLVGIQFTISAILIICALFVQKQMQFIRNYDTGFNKSQIMVIHSTWDGKQNERYKIMKDFCSSIPEIEMITAGSNYPTDGVNNYGSPVLTSNPDAKTSIGFVNVDYNYLPLLEAKFIQGRNFDRNLASDSSAIIVSESCLKQLGTNEVLGKTMDGLWDGRKRTVIGVVKDIYYSDLHSEADPLVFMVHHQWMTNSTRLLIKFKSEHYAQVRLKLEKKWKELCPDELFTYYFMEEKFEENYRKDSYTAFLMNAFTLLSVLLCVMGLTGLVAFSVQKRTKEIGIRKVNGARTIQLMALFNKSYIKWVAIAFVLACPVAWYAMHKWLENFAYKTALNWWVFAAAGVIAFVIALLTVSWQSWRAATRNPVESLRYE